MKLCLDIVEHRSEPATWAADAASAEAAGYDGIWLAETVENVSVPALKRGAALAGRKLDDFSITAMAMVATGDTEEDLAAADVATRRQIAFYASTPSYRAVCEYNGWAGLHDRLPPLAQSQRWDEMGGLIDDATRDSVAVEAEGSQVEPELRRRFGETFNRVAIAR